MPDDRNSSNPLNKPKRAGPSKPRERSGQAGGDDGGQPVCDDLEMNRVMAEINEVCAKAQQAAVQKYLHTARALFEARQHLSDSQFDQLWAEADRMMNRKLDLDRFLYVGETLGDLEPDLYRDLPRHWAILYCLAQVERDLIRAGVRAGKLHPKLSLKEAERLLGVSRYGPAGPREDEDPALYVLDDLMDGLKPLGLEIDGPDYPPDEYGFAGEVRGRECLLNLQLLDDDKGVYASVMIFDSEEDPDSVDFDREFPLHVTSQEIHDWVARCAGKLD